MSCIDWTDIMVYTNNHLETIKMKLNSSFDFILNDLDEINSETNRYLQRHLQKHVIYIAEQQRNIARMHRQISVAYELVSSNRVNSHNNIKNNSSQNLVWYIIFGLLLGIIYEKVIRLQIQSKTI